MKKVNKQKRLAFELSTSGLTAGLVLVMLALAQYSPAGKLCFFVLAAIMLLLPCIIDSLWGLVMSALAGGALALLFNPINVIPFACFFAPQVILMYLSKKYIDKKWFIHIPIKVVLLEIGIWGIYEIYGISIIERVFERFGWAYNYWFVMLISIPFVILYDYSMQMILRVLARRLNGIVCKYTDKVKKIPSTSNPDQNKSTDTNSTDIDQSDPFTDDDGNDLFD